MTATRRSVLLLEASPFPVEEGGFMFKLSRAGQVLVATSDATEVAEHMLQLGVEDPLSLVRAAREWGEVAIGTSP